MIARGGTGWSCLALVGLLFLALTRAAHADVDRIEVLERGLVADGKTFGNVGPYEQLRGRLYFAVEANAAENQAITDIKLAPRDGQGRVHFAVDFVLLKPADGARGNGRLLYEPPNRGRGLMLQQFNDADAGNLPASTEQGGNGFLMEQGYALLWTGWSWDVPPGNDRLRADLPVATEGGKAIEGLVNGEIAPEVPMTSAQYTAMMTVGYEPAAVDDRDARLTVRETAFGPRTAIPRERWQFGRKVDGRLIYDPAFITLNDGFKPGLIYTLTYTARGPRVAGLGLAGIRDALLFFRHERTDHVDTPNPLVENGGELPQAVLAYGQSQSARVLQTMIAQGLVADGRGRLAFDGALIGNAGAGKGGFNIRFDQSGRYFIPDEQLDYPSDWFPFTTTTETDPVAGQSGSVFDRLNAANAVPKVMYVNTSTEYWTRAASLIHTAVDGSTDISPDRRARIYMVAGGTNIPGGTSDRRNLAQCRNTLDYRPLLRALLLHLDGWVTLKKDPPPSIVPTLSDSTLGKLADYLGTAPKIPGLRMPTRVMEPPRLDFGPRFDNEGIASIVPPKAGKPYTVLLPLPDGDGIDKAGIRLPDVAVPLGTYTGWNLYNAATGAPDRLSGLEGSFVPFARNENERIAASDPRPSIAERYPKRDAYIESYAAAALALANKELIIGSDINGMVDHAGKLYDHLMARDPTSESCAFLQD
ncbi:MAG: hypothetical protein EPO08_13070 [Rhodospirillaceae bacterium]|nr:MAG: hypothetical protein EPO08_13070 [Rhodospirillaceae bacterium]